MIAAIGLFVLAMWGFFNDAGNIAANASKKESIKQLIDSQEGFQSSHFLAKIDMSNQLCGMAIDDSEGKFCLFKNEDVRIYSYPDLIETEILIGGKSVIKTSRASQFAGTAIGAVLAGGTGAIIGGLSGSKTTSEKVTEVKLQLLVNDTSNPIHVIDFIELIITGSTVLEIAHQEAQEWHNLLKVILKQSEDQEPAVSTEDSISDGLQKLSELKSSGAISEDEFGQAKKKLLT